MAIDSRQKLDGIGEDTKAGEPEENTFQVHAIRWYFGVVRMFGDSGLH